MSASPAPIRSVTPVEAARCAWVDVAKGMCIVLVVMMHATLGTGAAMSGEGFLHTVVAFAKPFRVPDFFLLSGLFLGRVIDRRWRLFADRRVVHFAYFYVLWVVIQSTVKAGPIVQGADGLAGGLSAFGSHLAWALIEPYSTLWFIYLLAIFSVVTKLLHRRMRPMILLAGSAALQILPLHGMPYLLEEFCGRYVYFLIGFLFAKSIFDIAQWSRGHVGTTLAGLAFWAILNAVLAFTATGHEAYPTLASLPVLSLVIGSLGAMAIVAIAALLTECGGPVTRALRSCGERSIVIYLAFFLPMALTRAAMVQADIDIGLACLVVTAVAVVTPLAFERLIRTTRLAFLFRRPAAFHIAEAPRRTLALRAV